ncbi:MAG: hypothetical protein O2971_08420 [Proteobacteria bacterium]|nr:hypothetical protein [Pseudomonadota bacterium]
MRLPELISLLSLMALSAESLAAANENCQLFQVDDGRLSIPVTVAGAETRAILNSGILTIGISSALAEQLGLEVLVPEPASRRQAIAVPQLRSVENVPVNVFGQEIEMEQIYVFDLDVPLVNLNVMMFRNFLVQIDFPQSQVCFLNPATINLEAAENINMRSTRAGTPAVEVILNGKEEVWLDFQIGYGGGISIDYDTADDLGFIEDNQSGTESSPTAVAVTESLLFGPYELGAINTNYAVEEGANARRSFPSEGVLRAGRRRNRAVETHGELGYEIMQHFVITIDFNEERMHVFAP